MSLYKEFRKDGWPLCPRCEEDELYSLLDWNGYEPRPLVEQWIAAGMRCYKCNWKSESDPPSIIVEQSIDLITDERNTALAANHRLGEQLSLAQAEVERLKAAIRKHRDQKRDDRCWLDDLELYSVLGDAVQPYNTLPPREEFLANCARYYENRCQAGQWPSYQELQAQVERLRKAERVAIAARELLLVRGYDGPCIGEEIEPLMRAIIEFDADMEVL